MVEAFHRKATVASIVSLVRTRFVGAAGVAVIVGVGVGVAVGVGVGAGVPVGVGVGVAVGVGCTGVVALALFEKPLNPASLEALSW